MYRTAEFVQLNEVDLWAARLYHYEKCGVRAVMHEGEKRRNSIKQSLLFGTPGRVELEWLKSIGVDIKPTGMSADLEEVKLTFHLPKLEN